MATPRSDPDASILPDDAAPIRCRSGVFDAVRWAVATAWVGMGVFLVQAYIPEWGLRPGSGSTAPEIAATAFGFFLAGLFWPFLMLAQGMVGEIPHAWPAWARMSVHFAPALLQGAAVLAVTRRALARAPDADAILRVGRRTAKWAVLGAGAFYVLLGAGYGFVL